MPTICGCGNKVALAPRNGEVKKIDQCGSCEPETLRKILDELDQETTYATSITESQKEVLERIAEELGGEVICADRRKTDIAKFVHAQIEAPPNESILLDNIPGNRKSIELPLMESGDAFIYRFSYYGFRYSVVVRW